MNIIIILFSILLITTLSIDENDKIIAPGMSDAVIYSGYLNTLNPNRKLHYVFVQSQLNPSQAPLTIWLNGGPGCSSLIGFMQQIGPYIVGNTYKDHDNLTKNDYRWNKVSNLLFIQSPGIVGFSTDTDHEFQYTDSQTADDAFEAIKYFIFEKAKQFANRQLFITGQSYAGKYIPDIVSRIINNNRMENTYINIKGILIGNGVMDFRDQSLTKSSIQFMVEHDFFSQRLLSVYRTSCQIDFHSPRCKYFRYQFSILRRFINHYNVYQVCTETGKSIQAIRLQQAIKQLEQNIQKYSENDQLLFKNNFADLKQINQCPSDQGMIDYLNLYKATFKVDHVKKNWTVCSDIKYTITPQGSMQQYKQIFMLNPAIKVWLFNGDWDDVVPYPDTLKNLVKLRRDKAGNLQPWFTGQHHAGFYQLYDSLTLITVKGASHMVPQTKSRASYQMFYNFINNKPINNNPDKSQM